MAKISWTKPQALALISRYKDISEVPAGGAADYLRARGAVESRARDVGRIGSSGGGADYRSEQDMYNMAIQGKFKNATEGREKAAHEMWGYGGAGAEAPNMQYDAKNYVGKTMPIVAANSANFELDETTYVPTGLWGRRGALSRR